MTPTELYRETDDISDSVIGVHLEVRTRHIRHWGWVAYTFTTGSGGGLRSFRALRDKHGKRVYSFHGKGELIEKINALAQRKQLAI